MQVADLVRIVMWIGGLSFTGFLMLCGWMFYLQKTTATGNETRDLLLEIRIALLGTFDKKGIVSRVHDNESNIKKIFEKLEIK